MPYKKKKNSFKKKSWKKKGSSKARGKAIQRRVTNALARKQVIIYHDKTSNPSAFPAQYYTTMNYRRQIELDNASAFAVRTYTPSALDKVFNLTAGNDVQEFDEMLVLFERYVVQSYDWEFKFINLSANPVQVTCHAWPHSESPTSNNIAMNRPGVRTYMLQGDASGSKSYRILKGHVNIAKLLGIKNVTIEEDLWGNGTTSPAIVPRFYITVSNTEGVSDQEWVADVNFKIHCKWFDRNSIPASADSQFGGRSFKPHFKSLKRNARTPPPPMAAIEEKDEEEMPAPKKKRRIIPCVLTPSGDYEMECL